MEFVILCGFGVNDAWMEVNWIWMGWECALEVSWFMNYNGCDLELNWIWKLME